MNMNMIEQVLANSVIQSSPTPLTQDHVEKVLSLVTNEGKTAGEISKQANIPRGTINAILNTASEIPDSHIVCENRAFRITDEGKTSQNTRATEKQNTVKEAKAETKPAKPAKSTQPANITNKLLNDTIITLQERPQTASNLADELNSTVEQIDQILNFLVEKGGLTVNKDTEWEEDIYIFNAEGYSKFIKEREEAKKKAASEKPKAKPEKTQAAKATKKTASSTKSSTPELVPIEEMVLDVIKNAEGGVIKLNRIQGKLPNSFTRVDINDAISKLEKENKIFSLNKKVKFPEYTTDAKLEGSKDPAVKAKKAAALKASSETKETTPTKSGSETTKATATQADKSAKAKEAKAKEAKNTDSKPSPVKQKEAKADTNTDTSVEEMPRPVQVSTELSDLPEIANLQASLAEVLPMLDETSRYRIEVAISSVEKRQQKLKNALVNAFGSMKDIVSEIS